MSSNAIDQIFEQYLKHPGVCTDSRQLKPGDIFFALSGPNFDGNAFAAQALEKGASLAVVSDEKLRDTPGMVWVPDTLAALQQVAARWRQSLHIPVLGITGSNGKTTSKELIHAVLSSKYRTSTTAGNLNNHIGIPLTLLRIPADAEMAVVEMGANHQREIASYCTYAQPSHGIITNCGKAHLEGFGGVEGVRKGKGELFDHLRATGGVAFICSDFDYFVPMSQGLREIHWYGTRSGEVTGEVVRAEPFLEIRLTGGFDGYSESAVFTRLVGDYNVYNVLAALTIGKYFGVPLPDMLAAIAAYEPSNSRSQWMEWNGNHVILDAYNANPTSMQAAVENFARLDVPNKVLLLGAMAELGDESLDEHQELVNLIGRHDWKEVVLVGGDFGRIRHPYRYFNNASEAGAWWWSEPRNGHYLLLKGSRSTGMEKVLEKPADA